MSENRLVKIVTASFNKIMGKLTETPQQKKQVPLQKMTIHMFHVIFHHHVICQLSQVTADVKQVNETGVCEKYFQVL